MTGIYQALRRPVSRPFPVGFPRQGRLGPPRDRELRHVPAAGMPEGLIEFGVSLADPRRRQRHRTGPQRRGRRQARFGTETGRPPEGGEFLVLAVELPLLESLDSMDRGLELSIPWTQDVRGPRPMPGQFDQNRRQENVGDLRPGARRMATPRGGACARRQDRRGAGTGREHRQRPRKNTRQKSAAVLAAARDALSVMEEFDYAALSAATGSSRRSIQMAFSQHLRMTPVGYFRAIRLHRARNALLSREGAGRRPSATSLRPWLLELEPVHPALPPAVREAPPRPGPARRQEEIGGDIEIPPHPAPAFSQPTCRQKPWRRTSRLSDGAGRLWLARSPGVRHR